jgi:hypothetical protein
LQTGEALRSSRIATTETTIGTQAASVVETLRNGRRIEIRAYRPQHRKNPQNWLSNTVFENYDAIIDAACAAWRKLIAKPETITSIAMRDWAHPGQPL